MPDYIDPIPAAQGQVDWPAMLHDLEKRVELLSDALDGVRLSMRRLVLAEPWLEEAIATYAADLPEHQAYMPPVDVGETVDQVDQPSNEDEALSRAIEEIAALAEPEPVQYDEDAREAVRRAVEEAKAQMSPDSWQEETAQSEEPQGEVSWIAAQEPQAEADDDEDAREAVRRAVEEAKGQMSDALQAEPAPYEEPQGQESWTPAAESAAEADEDEAAREAVRRVVEEARGERSLSGWGPAVPHSAEDAEDEARAAARRAVEEAKAHMGLGTPQPAPPATPEDEEAAREAVRQAVAQARAELAESASADSEAPRPPMEMPSHLPPGRAERIHPPTLTIEDPEGRVELARVYNLLKRLECAANSSLLNYSSRQVSVALSDNHSAPEGENVGDAVRDVFERECDVVVDGANVIVKLGNNYIRAA